MNLINVCIHAKYYCKISNIREKLNTSTQKLQDEPQRIILWRPLFRIFYLKLI